MSEPYSYDVESYEAQINRERAALRAPIFEEPPSDINDEWRHGALWLGLEYGQNFFEVALQYKNAADLLAKNTPRHAEGYEILAPVLFLYRHALEIVMKAVIRQHDGDIDLYKTYGHNLAKLLNRIQSLMTDAGYALPKLASNIVLEFHAQDSNSTGFRYPQPTEYKELWVDFRRLQFKINWLFDGLKKLYFLPISDGGSSA